ncbi:RHS repeat-associated core domain-containing protein [Burkholderia ubonensis]|uniref:RHS repeat-associated core domain-containing protein n=1 Tax=Burkholderia ubonensis TaxID=101571 RepID=UPI000B18873B|nr:RHS repeat-associated core domain-containing protein [Burkholderia ubonensis]
MNPAFGTPTLAVLDNRSQPVRALSYNRTTAGAPLDERIEHTIHDALGRVVSRCDARLFSAHATPNFTYTTSLSGQALRSAGVDAGTQLALADVDGRPVWARDARGTASTWTYDALGRPLTATDTPAGAAPAVRDAWIYGEAESDPTAHNLRGQCVRHYDPAGRLAWSGFRLSGVPLAESRTLLTDPEAEPDWSGDESAWAAALEPVAYPTAWTHDATGAWRTQTDAKGNLQTRRFDVAGRLSASTLTLAGGSARPVLAALDYSAAGQILTETAGNGVVSTYGYEPETQRLVRLTVTRPVQTGRPAVLQDLQYTYDPVGNVTGVTDAAQAPTYWRNQRVAPARAYTYDALYQLISATGRETVNRGQQGTTLPPATIPLPSDDTVYTNYTRTYTYDRGGNLTQIAHQGTTAYTQAIVVSATSNHALAQNAQGSLTPADVDAGAWFDAAGNQQNLLPDRTQPLAWNSRNRLSSVTLVQRGNGTNDRETYQYGADGMRLRKRTTTQTSGTSRTAEAIVLPGLTLRLTRSDDGQTVKVVEALHELRLDAGRTSARVLHWETGLPKDLANDALRFSHGELIGSIGLELDGEAELISREEYYPYGGTAVWSARSQVEADTKYVRYSGKERDSTGLYDYGWRSYQPWLGRWLNPDPAGTVDGLNLFRMVRNNPITIGDLDGRSPSFSSLVDQGVRYTEHKNGRRRWLLGEGRLMLHTGAANPASHLVIDAHGRFKGDTKEKDIPITREKKIHFFSPHYTRLRLGIAASLDPEKVGAIVTSEGGAVVAQKYLDNINSALEIANGGRSGLRQVNINTLISGSSASGNIANYSLKGFYPTEDRYQNISDELEKSGGRHDYLTFTSETDDMLIGDVFKILEKHNLTYTSFYMSFCRECDFHSPTTVRNSGLELDYLAAHNKPIERNLPACDGTALNSDSAKKSSSQSSTAPILSLSPDEQLEAVIKRMSKPGHVMI